MAITKSEIQALANGFASSLDTRMAERLKPLAVLIRSQDKQIRLLQKQITSLEKQRGYETIGESADGRPRVRKV